MAPNNENFPKMAKPMLINIMLHPVSKTQSVTFGLTN